MQANCYGPRCLSRLLVVVAALHGLSLMLMGHSIPRSKVSRKAVRAELMDTLVGEGWNC